VNLVDKRAALMFGCALVALGSAQSAFAQATAPSPETTASPEQPAADSDQTQASAGQQPAAGQAMGADIIVTAQKRAERLLDVPSSVTSVDTEALIDQNLVQMQDYANRIPGLQVTGGEVADISLRGVTTGGTVNPTVAILIDDIPYGSSTYLGAPPIPDLDPGLLQRIEVLRGPQGTLYGASSLGGLIKFVTRDPSTTEFFGRVEIGVASVQDGDTGYSTRAFVNVPIMADRIGLSVSGFYRRDPRWIDTLVGATEPPGRVGPGPVTGGTLFRDANENKVWGGRAALLIRPIDALTITLSALRQKGESQGGGGALICSLCGPVGFPEVTTDRRYSNVDLRTTLAGVDPSTEPSTSDIGLYSIRMNLDLGFGEVTSISAWGRNRISTVNDATSGFGSILDFDLGFPGTPVYPTEGKYTFGEPNSTNKFTQEVRLAGSVGTFDYLVGVFHTDEDTNFQQVIERLGPDPVVTVYSGSNLSTYKEDAVFGNLTWHATEKLELQVGARYAANDQKYNIVEVIDHPAQVLFGPGANRLFESSEKAFTWHVTPSYKFNPDVMAYIRVATGYRPGGPNTETPGAAPTFGNDSVINYEAGLKGSFFNRVLTLDTALFQINWKDIQLQNTAIPSQFIFFENGNEARVRGLEMAASVRPYRGISIDGNMTLLDAKLTEDLDRSTPDVQRLFGEAGDRLPFSPKFSANIGARYDFALSDALDAYAGVNLSYVGSRMGAFNQDTPAIRLQRPRIPSYSVVDLNAGLTLHNRWKLNFFARNVFDKKGFVGIGTGNGTLPRATGQLIRPRMIGVIASTDF
jgi:iron complex outermembrane recepter protein